METTTQLIQLVETSGVEKTKQNQISETLGKFFNQASEWDKTIEAIVITNPEETGKMKMAKEGRLTLKNMRLEALRLVAMKRGEVSNLMANYVLEDKLWLKAGQMMEATFKSLEAKLEEKENFAARWKAEQKNKLKGERLEILKAYGFQYEYGLDLGEMDESMFQSLKSDIIKQKEEIEAAEKKAEVERIEREIQLEKERVRIAEENERLKKEAEARQKELEKEREKLEALRKAEIEKAAKLKAEIEERVKEAEAKQKELQRQLIAKEKEAAAEKLLKEQEALRIEKERKAKEAEERKAAKAPIKKQLNIWVETFELPPFATENETAQMVFEKFEAFKKWSFQVIEAS